MNPDFPEPHDESQGAPRGGDPLTPALRENLADLALVSEECAQIAEGCQAADVSLAAYAARGGELGSAVCTLRRKAEELGVLLAELAPKVMRYSILLEDSAEGTHRTRNVGR